MRGRTGLYELAMLDERDDADLEELMGLDEEEADARFEADVARGQAEFDAMWARMTRDQQFAYRRRIYLSSCLTWRRSIRIPHMADLEHLFGDVSYRAKLREAQRRLYALRVERVTGMVMGGLQ